MSVSVRPALRLLTTRWHEMVSHHAARSHHLRLFSTVPPPTTQPTRPRYPMLSNREMLMIKDQESLFSDPKYFNLPVLMLHCQYTDFSASLHAHDKYVVENYLWGKVWKCDLSYVFRLDEVDCLWSCFPSDLRIYGSFQRLHGISKYIYFEQKCVIII